MENISENQILDNENQQEMICIGKPCENSGSQSRSWLVCGNYPKMTIEELYSHIEKSFKGIEYFCCVMEHGNGSEKNPDGLDHFHVYIEFKTPRYFSTMKSVFDDRTGKSPFLVMRKGSKSEARDYVFKQGKFLNKADTQISKVLEFGEFVSMEEEKSSTNKSFREIISLINEGCTLDYIFSNYPLVFLKNAKQIEHYYNAWKKNSVKGKRRNIEVIYISGKAGCGKTSYVMDKYGDENVFSSVEYEMVGRPAYFDGYDKEKILLLDEFRSGISMSTLLKYLDRYPADLTVRYGKVPAFYDKVYICSNWKLRDQYDTISKSSPTWAAFMRRISKVYNFDKSKEIEVYKDDEEKLKIQQHEFQVVENVVLPFGGVQ